VGGAAIWLRAGVKDGVSRALEYGAVVGLVVAARAHPEWREPVTHGWAVWGAVLGLWATIDWAAARGLGWTRRPVRWAAGGATLGHRTTLAALLAVVLPYALTWSWVASVGVLAGLAVTSSRAALLGVVAGVALLWPVAGVGLAALALALALDVVRGHVLGPPAGLLEWFTHRGQTHASIAGRWHVWRALWEAWPWLRGAGFGAAGRQLGVWGHAREPGTPWIQGGNVHNEPVEWAYETGLLGVVALGLIAWEIGPTLRIGDPVSAAIVSGAVVSLATPFLRVFPVAVVYWLTLAWGGR